jgi:aryl-alcohol dehydrogenase-like predicted oxidoreductase
LTGTLRSDTNFTGDDLRQSDPKFQPPRFAQYLDAVQRLDDLARKRYGKSVMDLAVRWVLDTPGITAALWGARHPSELEAVKSVLDWNFDADTRSAIDQILRQTIADPIGPEFMAPPLRNTVAA